MSEGWGEEGGGGGRRKRRGEEGGGRREGEEGRGEEGEGGERGEEGFTISLNEFLEETLLPVKLLSVVFVVTM